MRNSKLVYFFAGRAGRADFLSCDGPFEASARANQRRVAGRRAGGEPPTVNLAPACSGLPAGYLAGFLADAGAALASISVATIL
jgi:hypothetical protein